MNVLPFILFLSGGSEAGQPIRDLILLEHEKQKTLTIQKSLVTLSARSSDSGGHVGQISSG
jgi:hypothetical protein